MSSATPQVIPNTYEEVRDPAYDQLNFSSPHNRFEMDSIANYSVMESNAMYSTINLNPWHLSLLQTT